VITVPDAPHLDFLTASDGAAVAPGDEATGDRSDPSDLRSSSAKESVLIQISS